ncbi:hypothetical protein MTO96_046998 [Rhipicephalus appendiculatus]
MGRGPRAQRIATDVALVHGPPNPYAVLRLQVPLQSLAARRPYRGVVRGPTAILAAQERRWQREEREGGAVTLRLAFLDRRVAVVLAVVRSGAAP